VIEGGVKSGVYQHYKSGFYRVLYTARESTNNRQGRTVVVYMSLATGRLHTRDQDEFVALVNRDNGSPCTDRDNRRTERFTYIGEALPLP